MSQGSDLCSASPSELCSCWSVTQSFLRCWPKKTRCIHLAGECSSLSPPTISTTPNSSLQSARKSAGEDALPRLQAHVGPVWASVLIGLVWAGFMLPALGLVQMWSGAAILMYVIGLVSLSVEMTFAANLSGFSIIVAVVMHTLASAQSAYLSRGLIAHAQPRAHWEWVWSVSTLLVAAFLVLATRGSLGAHRQSDS